MAWLTVSDVTATNCIPCGQEFWWLATS